jgi:predicted permease
MPDLARVFSEVLLPIVVVAALGFAFRSRVPLDLRSLNRLGIYVLSPCLIFNTLLRADLSGGQTVRMLLFTLICIVLMGCLSLAASALLRLSRVEQSAFLLSTMFMNSGNYGLPLARFAFGEVGFQYAVLFYLVQAFLSQTLAVFIAARGQASSRDALGEVLRLPLLYAALGAMALRWLFGPPGDDTPMLLQGLEAGVQLLANAALPVLLLLLGMQLAEARAPSEGRRVALAVSMRLLLAAPLAYGVAMLLGLNAAATSVGLIQASMPTAVNVTILALEFDVRPRFVSSVVVVSTLASVATLTLLLTLIR